MNQINKVNFWTNGEEAVIMDNNDVVLISFDKVFVNGSYTNKIKKAMEKYGFDMTKQRMLTNNTLEDAIYTLNVRRRISGEPLTVTDSDLDTYVRNKINEFKGPTVLS